MSAIITVVNDPEGINEITPHEVEAGKPLLEWCIEEYGPNGFPVPTMAITADGVIIDLNEHGIDGKPLEDGESVILVHRPQGLDPLTIFLIAFVVGSVAAILLVPGIPTLEQPEFSQPTESPNNKLSGQVNIARPLQRIPDVYGKNRVYPDLIAKSYFEFINHIKYVTEFICVGRGEYLVEDLKSSNTLVSDIEGSTATVFGPSAGPAVVLDVTASNEVDGQELAAPNDAAFFSIDGLFIEEFTGSNMISDDGAMEEFTSLSAGDTFTIANSTSNNGVFTFQGLDRDSEEQGEPEIFTVSVSETFTTDLTGDTVNISSSSSKATEYGPFTVPGGQEFIWCDIQCPRGLQEIDGSAKSLIKVDFELDIQEIDGGGSPIGSVDTRAFSAQGNTQDPRFFTFKFVPNALTTGVGYEATVRRLTNTNNSSTVQTFDLTKWTRLAGVEDISEADYGDVTTIYLTTKATEQATSIQARKFNAVVTRKLNALKSDGTLEVAKTATAKTSDAVMHILTDSAMGNKPITSIDGAGLWTLQDSVEGDLIYGDLLGRFCYTFSNSNTPVADERNAALNAARMFPYSDGSTQRFGRSEAKPFAQTLFNMRNKAPGSETKNIRLQKQGDFDGVEISWTDEITGEPSTILFPEPSGGTRNKRIDGAGIKNYEQAWNRGKIEFLRLQLQRTTVENEVTKAGLLIVPGAKVQNVDGTNVTAQNGEILAVSGSVITTNNLIDFGAEPSGFVVLTDEEGATSIPQACTAGPNNKSLTLTGAAPFAIVTRSADDVQVGTIYSFIPGDTTKHEANDYIVAEVQPGADNYVGLTLVNYDAAIYGPDNETPTTL
jgi:hypothetical protein